MAFTISGRMRDLAAAADGAPCAAYYRARASGRARLTGRTLLQGLEMQRKGVVDGGMHHLVFRPTLNQSAVRIEVRICTCLPLSTLTPEPQHEHRGWWI